MNVIFILILMIFCHIVDDYYLQGLLKETKQKKWWEENAPSKLYKYDYLWALLMHSFSWSFMIMLPVAYYLEFDINSDFISLFIINIAAHAGIDHLKANEHKINLIEDQIAHITMILMTFTYLILV